MRSSSNRNRRACFGHGARCLVLIVAGNLSCKPAGFSCLEDSDCSASGQAGTCELIGYCSFPDEDCPSGRRFGNYSPGILADGCVQEAAEDSASGSTGGAGETGDDSSLETSEGDGSGDSSFPVPGDTGEATTSSNTSGDGTTSLGDQGDASSSGTTSSTEVIGDSVAPFIAVCTDPQNNDPALCETNSGDGVMTVDLYDGTVGQASTAFLRFDVPAEYEGGEMLSATLVLTVPDRESADSDSTGTLASTEPFDQASLELAQPVIVSEIGGDQGAVVQGDIVRWPLPVALLVPGQALHLAVVPVSNDGVDYWNATGAAPPRLDLTIEVSN